MGLRHANIDAERGMLSALLQGRDPVPALQELTSKDFFHRLHSRLFARIKSMVEEGEPLLLPALREKMNLDNVETAELSALLDPLLLVRSEQDLRGYIRLVKREARLRELVHACEKVVEANGDATGLVLDLQGKAANYVDSLRLVSEAPGILASTIEPSTVEWSWRGHIPLGKISVLDGDPDQGKSLLTMDIVARCTSGRPMPDGSPGITGGAVVLNAEDDEHDTIIPRLIAAGANLDSVRILNTVRTREGKRELELPADIPIIREAALSVDARLIIIDPLMAFLTSRANSWRDSDVRRALRPVAEMAAELRAAVVVVRHLNKSGEEGNPLYRGGGSIGIIGAARSGLLAGTDPDDETGETHVLAMTKSNLARKAPTLRYRLDPRGNTVVVRWLGESEHRASTILASPEGQERSKTEECARFLRGFLQDGAQPAAEIITAARKAGYSERTLDRAKIRLHIKPYLVGFGKDGKWMWPLPESAPSS